MVHKGYTVADCMVATAGGCVTPSVRPVLAMGPPLGVTLLRLGNENGIDEG